jgi:hypothetical protein
MLFSSLVELFPFGIRLGLVFVWLLSLSRFCLFFVSGFVDLGGFGGDGVGGGGGGGGCFGILSPVLNFWNSIFFWFSLDLEKPRICLSLLMNLFFLRGKKRHATVV